jgi:hypothetical protein
MEKPKGGRGKRVQYNTEMVRIPEPIKDRVLQLKQMFYDGQLEDYDNKLTNEPPLTEDEQKLISSLEDALVIARELIADNAKKKKSVKHLMAKLISSLFNANVNPDDL